jgi:hypothetical protein
MTPFIYHGLQTPIPVGNADAGLTPQIVTPFGVT